MNSIIYTKICFLSCFTASIIGCNNKIPQEVVQYIPKELTSAPHKKNIKIILGSTRQGNMSKKIGFVLKHIADKRDDLSTEIIDLSDYNLPFLYEPEAPAHRTVFTDPIIKKWSKCIGSSDGFILIVPEYNGGYPGVLKNALDLLYKEWNNKPVIFVGHSGGSSGGSHAIDQLRHVALAFKMIPIASTVLIPASWKALDLQGDLRDKNHADTFNKALDEVIKTRIQH